MSIELATATLNDFIEYQDTILRVSNVMGSTPVVIVSDGKLNTAQDIGEQVLALFGYQVRSTVFNTAKGA
jgi:hypothetical protein